jgi:hypothetical protein
VKLTPKFQNHDFYELDNIYLKYVNRNPRHIAQPNEDRFLNVTSNHRNDFFTEINNYFSNLSLSELMVKKPCVFNFTVIDYKYITAETCTATSLNEERKLDIKKQLVYEFALQLNYFGSWTFSEFWIPFFFDDNEKDFEAITNPNVMFTNSKIVIYKRNFLKLQESYIKVDE